MTYDKSKEIAAVLCPYLRAKSPMTPFRVLASDDDELFASVYRDLLAVGGRKGLFESRKAFVMTVLLHNEEWFRAASDTIELRSREPNTGFWTGAGEFKTTSAEVGAELGRMFEAIGYGSLTGADALFQVDITRVWGELSHLLESRDPAERDAGSISNLRHLKLQLSKKTRGLPPTQRPAESDALLAEIRDQTKRDTPPDISRERALGVFHERYPKTLVRWFDIKDTLPAGSDFYDGPTNCWFVEFFLTYDDPSVWPQSRLVAVSKSTGEIVYDRPGSAQNQFLDDSANDEG